MTSRSVKKHSAGWTKRWDDASFFLSWFLVGCLALVPLADSSIVHSHTVVITGLLVALISVLSCFFLRVRYEWLGLVLHIYSQVMIWLSITVLIIAAVICWGK